MEVIKRERKKKTAIDPKVKFEEGDNLTVQEAGEAIVANESESLDEYAREWMKGLDDIVKRKNESDDGRSKVSTKDWKIAAAAYATGHYEIDHIADKLGVANITVSKRFSDMGIKKGATEKIIEKTIHDKVTEAHFMSADEVSNIYSEFQKKANRYNDFVLDGAMKAAAASIKQTGTVAGAKDEILVFSKMADMIGRSHSNCREILNIRDTDTTNSDMMPHFEMFVMTESEEMSISDRANSEEFALGSPVTLVSYEGDDIIEELEDDDDA